MNEKKISSEMLIGISAMIISLSTLVVFIYQTNLIRKQQYMSVYPHLDLSNNNTGSLSFKYVLENKGVGPAFIKSIDIKEKNGKKHVSLLEYLKHKIKAEDSIYFHYSDLYEGALIQPKEEIILFGLSDPDYLKSYGMPNNTVKSSNKLRAYLNHDSLLVRITYESIYGEKWTLYRDSLTPIKH